MLYTSSSSITTAKMDVPSRPQLLTAYFSGASLVAIGYIVVSAIIYVRGRRTEVIFYGVRFIASAFILIAFVSYVRVCVFKLIRHQAGSNSSASMPAAELLSGTPYAATLSPSAQFTPFNSITPYDHSTPFAPSAHSATYDHSTPSVHSATYAPSAPLAPYAPEDPIFVTRGNQFGMYRTYPLTDQGQTLPMVPFNSQGQSGVLRTVSCTVQDRTGVLMTIPYIVQDRSVTLRSNVHPVPYHPADGYHTYSYSGQCLDTGNYPLPPNDIHSCSPNVENCYKPTALHNINDHSCSDNRNVPDNGSLNSKNNCNTRILRVGEMNQTPGNIEHDINDTVPPPPYNPEHVY